MLMFPRWMVDSPEAINRIGNTRPEGDDTPVWSYQLPEEPPYNNELIWQTYYNTLVIPNRYNREYLPIEGKRIPTPLFRVGSEFVPGTSFSSAAFITDRRWNEESWCWEYKTNRSDWSTF